MHRIPILQTLFDAARVEKQAGNDINVTPVYISIYPDGSVKSTNSHILSISGNPKYIIFCIRFPYQAFGRPSSVYYETQRRAFIDETGKIIDRIKIHNWGIKEITFGDELTITDFIIESEKDESFNYNFMDFQFISQIKFSAQMLWEVLCEIDIHCKTGQEANLYTRYYLKRIELQKATYTLDDYKQQLDDQKDLVKQHVELLKKIEELTKNQF